MNELAGKQLYLLIFLMHSPRLELRNLAGYKAIHSLVSKNSSPELNNKNTFSRIFLKSLKTFLLIYSPPAVQFLNYFTCNLESILQTEGCLKQPTTTHQTTYLPPYRTKYPVNPKGRFIHSVPCPCRSPAMPCR